MTEIIVPPSDKEEDNENKELVLDKILTTKQWTLSTEESYSSSSGSKYRDEIYVSDFSPFGSDDEPNDLMVQVQQQQQQQQQPVVDTFTTHPGASDIWFDDFFQNWSSVDKETEKGTPFAPFIFSFDSYDESELAGQSISMSCPSSSSEFKTTTTEEKEPNENNTVSIIEHVLDENHLTNEDKNEMEKCIEGFPKTSESCSYQPPTFPPNDEVKKFSQEMKKLLNEYLTTKVKWKADIMEEENQTRTFSNRESEYHYIELNIKEKSRDEEEEIQWNDTSKNHVSKKGSLPKTSSRYPRRKDFRENQEMKTYYDGSRQIINHREGRKINNNSIQNKSSSFRNYNSNNSENAIIQKIPTKSCLYSQNDCIPPTTFKTTFTFCGDIFCIFTPIQNTTILQEPIIKNVKFGKPSAVIFDPNCPTKELTPPAVSLNPLLLENSSDKDITSKNRVRRTESQG